MEKPVYIIRTKDRVLGAARSKKAAKKKIRKQFPQYKGLVIETFPELIADILASGGALGVDDSTADRMVNSRLCGGE